MRVQDSHNTKHKMWNPFLSAQPQSRNIMVCFARNKCGEWELVKVIA